MLNITIDGRKIAAEEGQTILQAAKAHGIDIPTLCYRKHINEIGSCRLCMVEIAGSDRIFASCRTKAQEGMEIRTETETLVQYRRQMLKLILSNHRLDCMSCAKNGDCRLQSLCNRYGVEKADSVGARMKIEEKMPILQDNPYLSYDPGKCIHCHTCISTCHEVAYNGALKSGRSGTFHIVEAPFGPDWKSTGCESCGNCAAACPTGALTLKRRKEYREWEVKKVRTTCPHCATGCQMDLVVKNNRIVDCEAADGPSNHRRLCVKGRSGSFDFVHSPDRLTNPLIKDRKTGEFREASWEEAIGYAATESIGTGGAVTGFILGGTFLPMVMVGIHQGLTPIHAELLSRYGVTILLPILAMAGGGQVGAAIAVYAKTRNKALRKTIASALPVGLMGVGEPLIYGVTLPLGKPFIGACIGGAFGGAVQAAYMVGAATIGISGLPLAASTDNIPMYLLGLVTAYAAGFIATWLLGFDDPKEGE